MRRLLVIIGVLAGTVLGGLSLTGAAAPSPTPITTTAAASIATAPVPAASLGCKDPNNWWDNLRINAGSMKHCNTNLDWAWEAGDASCTVASDARGVPELVNCAGTTPDTSGAIECWINVPTTTNGLPTKTTTVCTSSTDATHRDTIKARAATDPESIDGHCGFGDGACALFEGWSRALISDAVGGMVSILGTGQFTTQGALWDAASGEWSYWAWAVLGVMLIATVWSLVQAMASRDRADVATAITRALVAWPMILITYWLGRELVTVFDQWTLYTLTRGDSLAGVFRRFSQIIYAGGEGHYFMTFAISVAIWVGTKLLIVVFALRTLGLAALLMVGPVAWMMFPVKGIGPQWVIGYFSAGFTLLLAGPLTMGFVSLILRGLGNLTVLWSPEAWPLLLGLILVVFAPFAVMSLFSFAGAAAADRLGGAVGSAGRMGVSMGRSLGRGGGGAMRQAMRWAPAGRSNARPAGRGGQSSGSRKSTGKAGASRRGSTRPTSRANAGGRQERGKSAATSRTRAGRSSTPRYTEAGTSSKPQPAGRSSK